MILTAETEPEARLKHQLDDLERMLHQLTVLDRADGPEELNRAIDELLCCMGDYTHADCAYLFAFLEKNGAVCVERFLSTPLGTFDAILMDLQMPVINGLEATRTIRGLSRRDAGDIPILSMTANSSPADIRSCLEAGMTRHLAKPLDIHILLEALSECCKK